MAPTNSLRECMRGFGADPSRGIRIVMHNAGETSVRAICSRPMGPFHIVALGDSVMWGQGLGRWGTFAAQVRNALALAYIRPNPSNVREPHVFAHSGATLRGFVADKENLDPRPPGEIPLGYPSIPRQLELAKDSLDPEEVGLVLLNGGINDVDGRHILSPDPTVGPEWVRSETRRVMERMRAFLPTVLETFTKAKVVIPNYYQIISTDTEIGEIATLAFFLFNLPGPLVTAALRNKLDKQSEAFNLEWTSQVGSIIEELRTTRPELDPGRICPVDVQFGGRNAYGAPDSYLWKVVQIGFDFVTRDQVEEDRIRACEDAKNHAWGQDTSSGLFGYCNEAAAFHPNVSGANRYRDAIMNCIRSRDWIEEWRGGPWTWTYKEITASMDPPLGTPEGLPNQWTGKISARELQPPHYPVRGTVVISRNNVEVKRVPTDTEFTWTFAQRIIIDKELQIRDDRVVVQAPYASPFVLQAGGTRPFGE